MSASSTLARRLRRHQTEVERALWTRLRGRGLDGWKFKRQVPIGDHVVDFCCADASLIVELDGGHHSRDDQVERDQARTAVLEKAGYLVIRFWNDEVVNNLDGVCETIRAMARGENTL